MEPPENNTSAVPDVVSPQPTVQPDGLVSVPVAADNPPNAMPAPQNSPPLPPSQPATDPGAAVIQAVAQPTANLLNTPMPADADDTDLIEREWVDKAKAIVEHTKADPHLQNQEINKMKADYIQKRYNRQIKINEG